MDNFQCSFFTLSCSRAWIISHLTHKQVLSVSERITAWELSWRTHDHWLKVHIRGKVLLPKKVKMITGFQALENDQGRHYRDLKIFSLFGEGICPKPCQQGTILYKGYYFFIDFHFKINYVLLWKTIWVQT